MFLIFQTDFSKILSDGWTAIRNAPFQVGGFLVLYAVAVWGLVHRHYKNALEMERHLKETYKEKAETNIESVPKLKTDNERLKAVNQGRSEDLRKLQERFDVQRDQLRIVKQLEESGRSKAEVNEKEILKLNELIKIQDGQIEYSEEMRIKLGAEVAQLKRMEQELVELRNSCTPVETEFGIFSEGRKGHERQIADLTTAVSNLNVQIEKEKKHYEDSWKEELEARLNAQGNLAHTRILMAGLTGTSLNYTVVAQFIQPNEADIRTAKFITGLFSHPLAQLKAWDVWQVSQAVWFANPTDSRIVIVSDLEVAVEIQAALNEYKILGEYVGCTSRPPQPAGSIYGPATPDIRIVIFQK